MNAAPPPTSEADRFPLDSLDCCPACGYRLATLPTAGRCPECGLAYEHPVTLAFFGETRGWRRWLGSGVPRGGTFNWMWYALWGSYMSLYVSGPFTGGTGWRDAWWSSPWVLFVVLPAPLSILILRRVLVLWGSRARVRLAVSGCEQIDAFDATPALATAVYWWAWAMLAVVAWVFVNRLAPAGLRTGAAAVAAGVGLVYAALYLRARMRGGGARSRPGPGASTSRRGLARDLLMDPLTAWRDVWGVVSVPAGPGRWRLTIRRKGPNDGRRHSAPVDVEFDCTPEQADRLRMMVSVWWGRPVPAPAAAEDSAAVDTDAGDDVTGPPPADR